MRTSDLPEMRSLPLFKRMSETSFETLMEAAYLRTFPSQLNLIDEGDPADFLHVVIEGCVELYARSNGREVAMAIVRPARSFILDAVLADAVYLMSARTHQKSRILLIPAENVRVEFSSHQGFTQAVIEELIGCYRGVVREHKEMKLRTPVERLANRLLFYHRQQGANGTLELPYDKRIIASLVGMTPENLSRAFLTLKPYGVQVDGTAVKLSDLTSLETLAKPDPFIDDPDW